MIYSKCPVCKKGNPFEVCCGYEKLTGEKVFTLFDIIKRFFKLNK
jgi:hypothetical protein